MEKMPQGARSLAVCWASEYVGLWGCAAVTCFCEEREPTTGMVHLPMMLWWVSLVFCFFTHARAYQWRWLPLRSLLMPLLMPLTLKLLHGDTVHEDSKGIAGILPWNKGNTPGGGENWSSNRVTWEEKRKKKGVEGKDWELRVTLATKIGVRVVPCVLVILENIKAGWLETEGHYRDQRSLEPQ